MKGSRGPAAKMSCQGSLQDVYFSFQTGMLMISIWYAVGVVFKQKNLPCDDIGSIACHPITWHIIGLAVGFRTVPS